LENGSELKSTEIRKTGSYIKAVVTVIYEELEGRNKSGGVYCGA